jgi:predicted phosphate transport protein (TIGR00153 family)
LHRFSLRGREEAILAGTRQHLGLARSTVERFMELVRAVSAADATRSDELFNEVMSEEVHADEVHRELSLKIAEGAFFGGVREDFLNFLEKIDSIADSAKDAARLLMIEGITNQRALLILGSENMDSFLKALHAAVEALLHLIDAFEIDRKTVLSRVRTVEDCEELADTKKDLLLREIFGLAPNADALTVIQLRDFVFQADDIADNAEDGSDIVLILIAKGYA